MKISASKADVLWSYFGTIFGLSSSFILLPFVLMRLSGGELGLWYVFLAINGLVNLFDLGFDPTFARNFAYAWSGAIGVAATGAVRDDSATASTEPNYHLIAVLLQTSRKLYRRLASLALILVGSLGTVYVLNIANALSPSQYYLAWGVFCIGLFMNLFFGYFAALMRGIGAIKQINQVTMVGRIAQLALSIGLLYAGWGLLAVAIGFVVNGLVFRGLCHISFMHYQDAGRQTRTAIKTVGRREIRQVYKAVSYNANRDAFVALSNYLSTQATSLIAATFLPLSATAGYSILLQFANAIASVASTIIYAYHPTLQSAYLQGDVAKQREYIGKGLSAYYGLFGLGALGTAIVIIPLVDWMRPSLHLSLPLFIGIAIYIFLWQQQSSAAAFISNTNHVPYVKAFVFASITGTALSLGLARFTSLSVWSLIIGPGLVQLAFNNWYWLHRVMCRLQTDWATTIKAGFAQWLDAIINLNKGFFREKN